MSYVQRLLGHPSLLLTSKTYGSHLPPKATAGGVDRLDTRVVELRPAVEPVPAKASHASLSSDHPWPPR